MGLLLGLPLVEPNMVLPGSRQYPRLSSNSKAALRSLCASPHRSLQALNGSLAALLDEKEPEYGKAKRELRSPGVGRPLPLLPVLPEVQGKSLAITVDSLERTAAVLRELLGASLAGHGQRVGHWRHCKQRGKRRRASRQGASHNCSVRR